MGTGRQSPSVISGGGRGRQVVGRRGVTVRRATSRKNVTTRTRRRTSIGSASVSVSTARSSVGSRFERPGMTAGGTIFQSPNRIRTDMTMTSRRVLNGGGGGGVRKDYNGGTEYTSNVRNMRNPEWSKPIQQGERIPSCTFVTRSRNERGAFVYRDVSTESLFRRRRCVVFGMPGAFSPRCSEVHFPGYMALYEEIRALGVDDVYCVAVNDAFALRVFGQQQGLQEDYSEGSLGFKTIKLLPDGSARFTRGMGMSCMWDACRGMGERSWRYSAVISDMRVEKIFIENGGRIYANTSSDPVLASRAEVMVHYLKSCRAVDKLVGLHEEEQQQQGRLGTLNMVSERQKTKKSKSPSPSRSPDGSKSRSIGNSNGAQVDEKSILSNGSTKNGKKTINRVRFESYTSNGNSNSNVHNGNENSLQGEGAQVDANEEAEAQAQDVYYKTKALLGTDRSPPGGIHHNNNHSYNHHKGSNGFRWKKTGTPKMGKRTRILNELLGRNTPSSSPGDRSNITAGGGTFLNNGTYNADTMSTESPAGSDAEEQNQNHNNDSRHGNEKDPKREEEVDEEDDQSEDLAKIDRFFTENLAKSGRWDPRGTVVAPPLRAASSRRNRHDAAAHGIAGGVMPCRLSQSTCEVLERVTTTFNREFALMSEESEMSVAHANEFERILATEYPDFTVPSVRSLIKTCTHTLTARKEGARFSTGDWVEVQGPDMKWRLEMVRRILKEAPDDWDWNNPDNEGKTPEWVFKYNVGSGRMLDEEDMRAPEEGLRRIFGPRPWIWQQWAMLKIENNIRLSQGRKLDYFSTDVRKMASHLWERWLDCPLNAEFKAHFLDDRIGYIGRRELLDHIMKPFDLMEDFKREDTLWNFDDPSISIYTYLSVLGSGFIVPLVICVIQTVIPFLLYVAVVDQDSGNEFLGADVDMQVTKCMVFVVFLLYLCKVVPDTLSSFYNTIGTADSVYCRLLSLRKQIWSCGQDSFGQKLGYKIERFMNTAYVCLLYLLNMYILFKTDNAFEVLLNALAVEFVIRLDEDLASGDWWDPDRRWITAGAAELVLKKNIRLNCLSDPKLFASFYNIGEKELLEACDNDPDLLKNDGVACFDSVDISWMSKEEAVFFRVIEAAAKVNNVDALNDLRKAPVHFGWFDHFVASALGLKGVAVFDKYCAYRTWSRWERVLYLGPVPDLEELYVVDRMGIVRVRADLDYVVPTDERPFANFHATEFGVEPFTIFMQGFWDVVTFKSLACRLTESAESEKWFSLLPAALDGLLEWLTYVIQVIFPLVAVLAPFALIGGMRLESLIVPKDLPVAKAVKEFFFVNNTAAGRVNYKLFDL